MAFIDNPIIASLGSSLGLQPLFEAAGGGGSPQPDPQQSAPRPAASKPNVPEYKNRPYIPRNEGGTGGVRPGVVGANPAMPGPMSQDTLQSPQVQALLGQYGVHPSTAAPDPNLFIHNPEAYQRHPLAAGLLEHGLRGLAYAHPGNNWLDSLIGGVRGIQESNATSAQQVNNQLMAPIQQAQAVQSLQHGADEHDNVTSEIQNRKDILAHLRQTEETKQERIMAHQPYTNPKTGQTFSLGEDEDGNPRWTGDPKFEADPEIAFQHQRFKNAAAPLIEKYGSLDKVPSDELEAAYTKLISNQSLAKGAAGIKEKQIGANATVTAAGIRGSGRGAGGIKFTPVDADAVKTIEKQQQQLDKQNAPGGIMYDDDNKMVIGGTPKGNALVQKRKADLDTQKKSITDKYVSAPSASKPSGNSNPMTSTPQAQPKGKYLPGFVPLNQ